MGIYIMVFVFSL